VKIDQKKKKIKEDEEFLVVLMFGKESSIKFKVDEGR
jgi:hypothetical protein